jgi:hypothetical protein
MKVAVTMSHNQYTNDRSGKRLKKRAARRQPRDDCYAMNDTVNYSPKE